jgi:hypothetical protein
MLLAGQCVFGLQDRHIVLSESHDFYLSQIDSSEEMDELKDEPFLAISLGHNCWPAAHLQDHALRKRSFPLDWLITSFDTIYQLFETDFNGFLDIRHFFMPNTLTVSSIHGAEFGHDFTLENWKQVGEGIVPLNDAARKEYQDMLFRYQKRIARFYAVFELGIPIYLFRWKITHEQAHQLYALLTKKFSNTDIFLICLHDEEIDLNQDRGHPNIKHFPIGWDGKPLGPAANRSRNPEWTKVFTDLELLLYSWNTND